MYKLLRCPECKTISKTVEKVQFVRGQIYERIKVDTNNKEVLHRREDDDPNMDIFKQFYRCSECGYETEKINTWITDHEW